MYQCSIPGCTNPAAYNVIIYQFNTSTGGVLCERDEDCPHMCVPHARENEKESMRFDYNYGKGETGEYKYTNKTNLEGFSIYLPIEYCDMQKELPEEKRKEVDEKIGAFCRQTTEAVAETGWSYSYKIYGCNVTLFVTQPMFDEKGENNRKVALPVLQMRYERKGGWIFSNTELEGEYLWRPASTFKREWMVYWQRKTDEWLRVSDANTNSSIEYWIDYIENNDDGIFDH